MTKKEFLDVLIPELRRLEEVEHLTELAEEGRYDEVGAIVGGIDYSQMDKYMDCVDEGDEEAIDITEIPSEYMRAYLLYLWGSEYDETEVMKCWKELQYVLATFGSMWKVSAEKMNHQCLTDFFSLEELFTPDEEDAVD